MSYVRKLYCMYRCMYNKRPGQCLQCYHGCQASWGQGAWRAEQQGIQPHSGRHCYGEKMRNSQNIIFWRLTGLSCWSGCTHICRTGYWLPQWLIRYMHECRDQFEHLYCSYSNAVVITRQTTWLAENNCLQRFNSACSPPIWFHCYDQPYTTVGLDWMPISTWHANNISTMTNMPVWPMYQCMTHGQQSTKYCTPLVHQGQAVVQAFFNFIHKYMIYHSIRDS